MKVDQMTLTYTEPNAQIMGELVSLAVDHFIGAGRVNIARAAVLTMPGDNGTKLHIYAAAEREDDKAAFFIRLFANAGSYEWKLKQAKRGRPDAWAYDKCDTCDDLDQAYRKLDRMVNDKKHHASAEVEEEYSDWLSMHLTGLGTSSTTSSATASPIPLVVSPDAVVVPGAIPIVAPGAPAPVPGSWSGDW